MKIFNKKAANFLAIAGITLLFFLTSCVKKDDYIVVSGDASIKVVNTIQGSDAQDFYQNEKKLSITPISYGASSEYITVTAGTATNISLKNTSNATVSATSLIAPQVGGKYTVFYYSNQSGAGMISGLANDISTVAAGKIKVRFLNLGSILQNTLNIETSTGTSLVTGLAYNYSSQYQTIDDNLALNVKIVGATESLIIPNTSFQTGKNYTVWFDASNPTTAKYHIVLEN